MFKDACFSFFHHLRKATSKIKMNMKIFIWFLISIASATLQAAYLNKMSNAISSFNLFRARKSSSRIPSVEQQIYNFQLKNAKTVDELFKIMKFHAAQQKRATGRRNQHAQIHFQQKRKEK